MAADSYLILSLYMHKYFLYFYYKYSRLELSGDLMGKLSIVAEFWDFIKVRKKWWLAPIILILLLLSALIILSQGSALAPFIYAIF